MSAAEQGRSVRERLEEVEQAAREGLEARVAAFCEDWSGWESRENEQSLEVFWLVVFPNTDDELPVSTTFDDDLGGWISTVVIGGGSLELMSQQPIPAMSVEVDWRQVTEESLLAVAEAIYTACRKVAAAYDASAA